MGVNNKRYPGHTGYHEGLQYGPSDETRRDACEIPFYAYLYAREVDKGAREDTRKASAAAYAYHYAVDVDRGAHESTRNAVLTDMWTANLYAKAVDKWLHPKIVCVLDVITKARTEELLEFD